jgi:hypothetical protein
MAFCKQKITIASLIQTMSHKKYSNHNSVFSLLPVFFSFLGTQVVIFNLTQKNTKQVSFKTILQLVRFKQKSKKIIKFNEQPNKP